MGIKNKLLCAAAATVSAVLCFSACGGGGSSVSAGDSSGSKDSAKESSAPAREYHNYPVYDAVDFSLDLWQKQEFKYCPEYDRKEDDCNIKGIFLRSDYKGEESYAFGYLGIPEGTKEKDNKPAVLLIHGGGGTAYYQWVREWNDRGYVALALDMEGHIPKESGTVDNAPADLYVKSEYPAPHNQNYADADNLPIEETWMYYAVSTAIRGNSFLRKLDCVDKDKVGICGISWGGVITSITSGYDDRFAFSVPIYCTLNNYGSTGNIPSYYVNHANALVWDDDTGLAAVSTPILFLAGINDVNQAPHTVSKTASHCKNARISLVKGFLHSHGHAIGRNEPFAFADEIVFGKKTMVTFENNELDKTNKTVKISVPEGVTVSRSGLVSTDGEGLTGASGWEVNSFKSETDTITYELPAGVTTYYYFFVETSDGLIASTLIAENK